MVDETFVERFKKEARILASLEHPNIVSIYELGEVEGRVFIAMRYLPGGSLQQLIQKEGSLSFDKSLSILKQVCEGLQVAHEQGLVHRDIKPANILFDAKGNAVISDFGLARAVQLSGASSSMGIAGTPAYRAPELWRGKPAASPATDVYSLGCVLFEMLTGKVLFDGDTPDEILTKHLIDGPTFPEKWPEGMPLGLVQVITKAIEKDPTKRQLNAKELISEVEHTNSEILVPAVVHSKKSELEETEGAIFQKEIIDIEKREVHKGHPKEMSIELAPGVQMEFVYVPAGEFLMGSDPKIDPKSQKEEQPQHKVNLDAYWIGKYPVTNRQYQLFIKENKQAPPIIWEDNNYSQGKAEHPVVYVNWNNAQAFCTWLSEKTKHKINLPTEAQWEKAARGTDGRIYPWGNQSPNSTLANYSKLIGDTSVVESYVKGISPYGAMNMSGNVWEWVADWYSNYSSEPLFNPVVLVEGAYRILRGGSWVNSEINLRSANRGRVSSSGLGNNFGFRCSLLQTT
jgi:formylglycine-generating enzyme required for sulfatase activity